jgi:NAD(P) transhydrogenase
VQAGFTVLVESQAGKSAGIPDSDYEKSGARIVTATEAWQADIIAKVQAPTLEEASLLGDRTLISLVYPSQGIALLQKLQSQGSTVFALDCIPRLLSRGQAFDVLSSQANIAGYRAVIETSNEFGRLFTGQITAAGKVI